MHLYFIRHAQSANNDLYTRTGGSEGRAADPPLTDLGHRQARLLAQHLAQAHDGDFARLGRLVGEYAARQNRLGYGLTHLYCSLMTRAVQTAGYVAVVTGLPLVGWPEVHERGGLHLLDEESGEEVGVPGPNRAEFMEKFPSLTLPDAIGDLGWWSRPMETADEATLRARVVWTQLLERHGDTDDRVAIVSHAGFFQSLMNVLLGGDAQPTLPAVGKFELWYGISNTAINRIECGDGAVVVRYLNRVDFLPDELVTG